MISYTVIFLEKLRNSTKKWIQDGSLVYRDMESELTKYLASVNIP